MARGKAPRLSNPPTILPDEGWTELLEMGGGACWGHMGWVGFRGGGTTGVHRLKVNVPYQHKKEHMSSALPNYCHIEQFKHLI